MKFSKTTGNFYPDSVQYEAIPTDAIDVPLVDYERAISRSAEDCLEVVNGRVTVVRSSSDILRENKWQEIKNERDRLTYQGGYRVGDKWFHSDLKSRLQQQDNELAGEGLASISWKTMDGSFIDLTPELVGLVREARMASDRAIFSAAEQHRQALYSCDYPDQYDFSAGWPEVFTG